MRHGWVSPNLISNAQSVARIKCEVDSFICSTEMKKKRKKETNFEIQLEAAPEFDGATRDNAAMLDGWPQGEQAEAQGFCLYRAFSQNVCINFFIQKS